MVNKESKNPIFFVGITGLLLEDHSQNEAEVIFNILDRTISNTDNVIICSRFVNKGISKIAYDWAFERSIPTAGVAPQKAWEHACRMVDTVEIKGFDWGEEVDTFVKTCDGIVNFWHTEHSLEIMKKMKDKGGQVLDMTTEYETMLARYMDAG
jgi:hypothetical protein